MPSLKEPATPKQAIDELLEEATELGRMEGRAES